ncbi:MAG TPA: hypothetical protein VHY91_00335 [Pirellulales bacterium]|nr:hypothetical protein [Pirellulales bacterium]
MSTAHTELVDQLGAVRRRLLARWGAQALLLVAIAAAAALLMSTLADQGVQLGSAGRAVAALLVYGTAAIVFWRASRSLRTRHSEDYFAALVEQKTPRLHGRIINALQLGREKAPTMTKIIDAIVLEGQEALETVDLRVVTRSAWLGRLAAALAATALVWLAYAWIGGPAVPVSISRVLLPWAEIEPFTFTQLELRPAEPQRLLEGSPLAVEATAHDRTGAAPPERASIAWRDAAGRERRVEMKSAPDGNFAYVFPSVESSMTVWVSAGDANSGRLAVQVDPRPRVVGMSALLHPPAYTAQDDHKIDAFDGQIEALPGTRVELTVETNKDLQSLALQTDAGQSVPFQTVGDGARQWQGAIEVEKAGWYRLRMVDVQDYEVDAPIDYRITLLRDEPPTVALTRPGRDLVLPPEASIEFAVTAQDRYGLGAVRLVARVNDSETLKTLEEWPAAEKPVRQAEVNVGKTLAELGLKSGDHLQYWATAEDRNPGTPEQPGPGRSQSRVFHLSVVSPQQAEQILNQQINDYSKAIAELIKLQRQNRGETASQLPARPLVEREGLIVRQTRRIADVMQQSSFPAVTIIDELRDLAADPMAKVLAALEGYRDAAEPPAGQKLADASLPIQDDILRRLEALQLRLDRDEQTQRALKKLEKEDPPAAKQVNAKLEKLAKDLDSFLSDLKDLEDKYERMPKRDQPEAKAEDAAPLADAEHRLDRWKKWAKGTIDDLAKLPHDLGTHSGLTENLTAIFEEVEKKPRGPTQEMATAAPDNGKATAQTVLEDLELWNSDKGDSTHWAMEDHPEGRNQAIDTPVPENLQDVVGDLIEDIDEFDKEADDATATSSGNAQAGWDIGDGPMSSFGAVGKTGNQLPNDSEIGGRSGSGRRGKSTGKSVGDENSALEGRPTPARTTNEPYEEGNIKSKKQLDARGSTGGGKKTGGGEHGLQGGTRPDFAREAERLEKLQKQMREKTQQVAKITQATGKSSPRVERAVELMDEAVKDAADHRYQDAARKRKTAIGNLKAEQSQISESVNLSLRKATYLPADMRGQIGAAAGQALPEGYENLVGQYYKALSTAGQHDAAPGKSP